MRNWSSSKHCSITVWLKAVHVGWISPSLLWSCHQLSKFHVLSVSRVIGKLGKYKVTRLNSLCSECSSTLIISFENALSKVKSQWRKDMKLKEQREASFVRCWKAEQFWLFLKVCWCCWWFLATFVFCILQSNQGDLGVVYRGLFLPASFNNAKYTCGRV